MPYLDYLLQLLIACSATLVASTGKWVEELVVESSQLRASKLRAERTQLLSSPAKHRTNKTEDRVTDVREASEGTLQQEASGLVAVGKIASVENTTSKICKIDSSKRVGRAGVSTDAHNARVHRVVDLDIGKDFGDVVGIGSRALVPIIRDTLLTAIVYK